MEHYVTLFDSNFLPQGLALHESLQRHAAPCQLWVLCMDEPVQVALERLALPGLRTIALSEVEAQFPQLLSIKPSRSRAEYCWTLTPFTPKLIFDRDAQASRATYVDADMFLLASPAPVFSDLDASGKAVQITDHAYDPAYDQAAVSGRFCVQFVTFVRGASEPVRREWQAQCVEWCFSKPEPGRFGDQKYLDEWPVRHAGLVHVLTRTELLMAPWNARCHDAAGAVAWHFHGLRLLGDGRVLLHSGYDVPASVDAQVYTPYVASLRRQLARVGGAAVVQARPEPALMAALRVLVRVLCRGFRPLRERRRIVAM